MTYNTCNIIIPTWVSCHTYKFGEKDSRTYISNEKNHIYFQLDGLASDMWQMIIDKIDNNEFLKWLTDKGIEGQVDDFIAELENQELLVIDLKNEDRKELSTYSYKEISNTFNDEETKFVEEMRNWLFDNKFLFSLFFELTYRCNLKCVHCYNPKDMSHIEIDFEKCKQIIDDAYDLGCFKITFSGGESTLHSKFIEIIEYARSKRISVEIFTNGQLLATDESLYKKVLALYPYRIGVSLYSTEEETHERVTAVKGSYNKTYYLIERLRKDNVNVQIKNFLLNINCKDCIKVMNYGKRVNATVVADLSLIPKIDGDKKNFKYLLEEDKLLELYSNADSPLYVGHDYKLHNLEKILNDIPCLGGVVGLCISPSLDINVCVSMPKPVGNLKKDSLKDIWQGAMNKDEKNRLYKWQKLTIKDLKECYKEEYCRFCSYCPGMGYLENGYLKKSDVLCAQAKAKMKAYYRAKK